MIDVLYQQDRLEKFSGNNLELLIAQLSNYEPNAGELKGNEELFSSYLKGAKFIMENLLELYNNVKNSVMGSAKIYALNLTVNKKVLSTFLKEIKEELGITYKIFQGGALDIPVAKNIIDNLEKNYESNRLDAEAFMLGAKKVAKIIEYAYNAPLTRPFQNYIINESKSVVKNISEKLNSL